MAYSFYRAITINAGLCGTANSTGFPVYFAGGSFLATVANGGGVQSASGYDIVFFADAGLTQALPFEMVSYAPATGVGEWHVQIATLSATANTVFYVGYGDASATTSKATPTSVWDSSYAAVYHLGDGSTVSGADSTVNANTGAVQGGVMPSVGRVGGAGSFNGSSSGYIDCGNASSLNIPGPLTLEAWVNFSYIPGSGSYGVAVSKGYDGTSEQYALEYLGGNGLQVECYNNSTNGGNAHYSGSYQTGVWYHWFGTYDGSSTFTVYQNGVQVGSGSYSGALPSCTENVLIGGFGFTNSYQRFFEGLIDEVRISDAVRSASWIAAQYNNQSSPSTFYAVGAQQAVGSAVTPTPPAPTALLFL